MRSGHKAGGPQEAGVVFHRMKARNQADQDGIVGDAQLCANLVARIAVRTEHFTIEPTGNDDLLSGPITERCMLLRTQPAVVDDGGGMPGEESAEANHGCGKPGPHREVVEGHLNIPKHGHTVSCANPGEAGHEIAVRHPALDELRAKAARETDDRKGTKGIYDWPAQTQ